MQATRRGERLVVGGDARQRFHDAAGYGRPLDGDDLELAPVEAAHLCYRGELDRVAGQDFATFVAGEAALARRFVVYADLRDRGFYVTPARDGWVDGPTRGDLTVFARGDSPPDGERAYDVQTVGEHAPIQLADLGETVLAVADAEGECTYFETSRPDPSGSATDEPSEPLFGRLFDDRVLVQSAPSAPYERGFYGHPLGDDRLLFSLTEAAYLAERGLLDLADDSDDPPSVAVDAIVERGRDLAGDAFDRNRVVYTALRERGVVPKSGYKFGADFRTYPEFTSVEDLGHSESLVVTLPPEATLSPRELSLYVRLAGGVRKRTVFALSDGTRNTTPAWRSATRLTP
jgi:tRNA-intron endonuclease